MEFNHVSVLLDECIDNLNIKEDGVYVDCTMGGAGHSKEIVKRLSKDGLFIGFDQDKNAIATAKERLAEYSDRVRFVHSNFSNIKEELEKIGVYKIDGVLADLGVSSHQLDEADRGFSYMHDAPLDMSRIVLLLYLLIDQVFYIYYNHFLKCLEVEHFL